MKKLLFTLLCLPLCLQAQTPKTTIASDTIGHKLLMTFTDQDSLQDTLPQRTSYQSFFGKNKTEYNMCYAATSYDPNPEEKPMYMGIVGTILFEFKEKKSEYNGKIYKLSDYYDIYLREDTVLGRLYRYYPELDTEVVLCDMSLQQGDTFRLPWLKVMHLPNWRDYCYNEWGYPIVVDTVFYVGKRKHINFYYIKDRSSIFYDNEGVCKEYGLPLSFIEGIGPSYGLGFLPVSLELYLPLMLCLHKDDTIAFKLHEPTGCKHNEFAVKEPKRTTLTLQPNPAQDYILLRNEEASDLGGEIIITDAIGRVMRHCTMENAEMRINTSRYSSGTYFVRYRSKNGVQTLKFVKVQ
ncbi:MAG: T9SS type A sorting domain-containing protein [Bacteroidales bacterium]|nr:T9SS type A sorting domain-containing protein [Bacteroidales bacterium]